MQSLYGQFYNQGKDSHLSTTLHDHQRSSTMQKFQTLKELVLPNDKIKSFQFIEPINMCIILTNRQLLVWDMIQNEVIIEHNYLSTQLEQNSTISYNLLVENSDLSQGSRIYLVLHESSNKQLSIIKFKVQIYKNKSNFIPHIVPDGDVEYFEAMADNRIEVIEELSTNTITSINQLKSQILVQLSDQSLRFLKCHSQITLSYSFNFNQSSEQDKSTYQQLKSIFAFSDNTYILLLAANQQIQLFDANKQLFNQNIILIDVSIDQLGSFDEGNYKFLVYRQGNEDKLYVAFVSKYDNKIFQKLEFTGISLFKTLSNHSDALYFQNNDTKQVFSIKFKCIKYNCTELRRQSVNLPQNSIYLINKKSSQNSIFISFEQSQLRVSYIQCVNQNEKLNLLDFTCYHKDLCSNHVCFFRTAKRNLDSYEQSSDSSINSNNTSTSNLTEDSSQSDAVKIVQIVLSIVGAIVLLTIAVLCIRKHRQRQFKKQKQKDEEEEAKKAAANNNQSNFQLNSQQYIQLPVAPYNGEKNLLPPSNFGIQQRNESRQLQPVGASNIPSNINNQFSQNMQQVINPQFVNHPANFQNLALQQQMSGQPGINGMINPVLQGPVMMQNDIGLQGNLQLLDPALAEEQKQLMMQEIKLKKIELMIRENQLQQQLPQLPPQPFYQMNDIPQQDYNQNNMINNNFNNNDNNNRPQSDYQRLAAQIADNQYVKQHNDNRGIKQNGVDLSTPTPDQFQYKEMNYNPIPPAPAPPVQDQQNIYNQKAPLNYSVPKNGYFFGKKEQQIYQQSQKNQFNQSINNNNNLNNTEVQKNNFEQQMMALMASGALPAQAEKNEPFIQPPIMEEGEHEGGEQIQQQQIQKEQLNFNQSQSIKLNHDIASTQVQRQNFEDEILRQLQGTEVFQKYKQMQNQEGLQPIAEKEFPKFIHDQEEQPDSLHKFDEEEEDDDQFDVNNNENNIDENIQKNKILHRSCNPQIPHPSQIKKPVNGEAHKIQMNNIPNHHLNGQSQDLGQSNPNNFLDFMKDQLGESLGQNKPEKRFIIESQIEQHPIYVGYNNQQKNDVIDINQINLVQNENQEIQNVNEKIQIKGNYQNILQVTDPGAAIPINQPNLNLNGDDDKKATCKICLDNPPQVAFQCGHILCEPCTISIQKQNNICPLCYIPIQQTLKIFF